MICLKMEFISSLVKKRFTLKQILLLVVAITTIRIAIDWVLLEYPIEINIFQDFTRFYLENLYYFLIIFLLLTFFISKILGNKLIDVANFGIKFFPVIIIPPLIDFFFFNRTEGYNYATVENFSYNFLTLSILKGDASPGIIVEVLLVFLFVSLYVFYIKRYFLLSILAGYLTSLIIVIISTPDLFFGNGMGDYYYDYFLPSYYFFPLIFLAIFLCYYYEKEKLKAILSNFRLLKSMMFMIAVVLGSLATTNFGYNFDLYRTFLASIVSFFGWQFSIVINDIYDYEIDKITNKNRPLVKKIISKNDYKFVALIIAFLALSFSAILSLKILLLTILGLVLGVIYSIPPIRLRKYIAGNLIMGISLVISFSIGFLIANDSRLLLHSKNLIFILLLFLFGTVITFTKDIKDIKSDSRYGIQNFYTVFGKERGKKIVIILLFIVLNLPSLILKDLAILPITIVLSSLTCWVYYKKEDEKLAYIMSALLGIYVFVKLFYF